MSAFVYVKNRVNITLLIRPNWVRKFYFIIANSTPGNSHVAKSERDRNYRYRLSTINFIHESTIRVDYFSHYPQYVIKHINNFDKKKRGNRETFYDELGKSFHKKYSIINSKVHGRVDAQSVLISSPIVIEGHFFQFYKEFLYIHWLGLRVYTRLQFETPQRKIPEKNQFWCSTTTSFRENYPSRFIST